MSEKYIIRDEEEEINPNIYGNSGLPVTYHLPSDQIDLEGKRLIFFRVLSADRMLHNTVVPGIAVSEEYRDEYNAKCVDVEPIIDAALRQTLVERLGQGAPVNFW